jgi:hypothetical protein
MASTISTFIAAIALIVNSFCILVMFFLGNVMLAPIIGQLEKMVTGTEVIPMSNMGYIVPSIWAILIIMEIVCAGAFLVVIARRETPEDYYGGY